MAMGGSVFRRAALGRFLFVSCVLLAIPPRRWTTSRKALCPPPSFGPSAVMWPQSVGWPRNVSKAVLEAWRRASSRSR
eukprot:1485378-Prymnesium_polylepis.2